MRYPLLLLLLLLADMGHANLQQALNNIFAQDEDAAWSVCVERLADRRRVYELNPDRALIPASNQKLVTSAAALLGLGPQHREETAIVLDGPIVDGVLQGNIVVVAGGAIFFTGRYQQNVTYLELEREMRERFNRLARRLADKGVRAVSGNVVIDSSSWTNLSRNTHYHSAWGVSYNENTLMVRVNDRDITTFPSELYEMRVYQHIFDGAQRKVRRHNQLTDRIEVNPARNSEDYWRLDETDPNRWFAHHFALGLQRAGISLGAVPVDSPGRRVPLTRLEGLDVASIVQDMGVHSDNFRAELLFLNLGRNKHGTANYQTGPAAIHTIFRENGLEFPSMVVADGSGLSRDNRISAADVVVLLQHMDRTELCALWRRCFPVSGKTGTLKNHLTVPALAGQVQAKTGTLDGVKNLSGYLRTSNEGDYVFSVQANEVSSPERFWAIMEDFCIQLRQF